MHKQDPGGKDDDEHEEEEEEEEISGDGTTMMRKTTMDIVCGEKESSDSTWTTWMYLPSQCN